MQERESESKTARVIDRIRCLKRSNRRSFVQKGLTLSYILLEK